MPAPFLEDFHQQIRCSIENLGLFGEPIRRVNVSFEADDLHDLFQVADGIL